MTAKIFLAHANEDKERVRRVYSELASRGFQPWMDEVNLIPGQQWQPEIEKAIRESDVFLACLSRQSIAKSGYVQRELRLALTTYASKPPGSIFLIPLKLDECDIPDYQLPDLGVRLRDFHWLDYWKPDGVERLVVAIKAATGSLDSRPPKAPPSLSPERQKLEYEIEHRLRLLPSLLLDVFTYTQLHTAKGAILGKTEHHPRVGKLGNFEPLFQDFRGASLFSLIWTLRQLVPERDRGPIDRQLASARELPHYFDKLVMLAPVGEEDSKWQVDRSHIDRLRTLLRVLSEEAKRDEPESRQPESGPP